MSELYSFAAVTPRTFPCEGQRVAERRCPRFAVVRVGVANLCGEHARDELTCAYQAALVRLATVSVEQEPLGSAARLVTRLVGGDREL